MRPWVSVRALGDLDLEDRVVQVACAGRADRGLDQRQAARRRRAGSGGAGGRRRAAPGSTATETSSSTPPSTPAGTSSSSPSSNSMVFSAAMRLGRRPRQRADAALQPRQVLRQACARDRAGRRASSRSARKRPSTKTARRGACAGAAARCAPSDAWSAARRRPACATGARSVYFHGLDAARREARARGRPRRPRSRSASSQGMRAPGRRSAQPLVAARGSPPRRSVHRASCRAPGRRRSPAPPAPAPVPARPTSRCGPPISTCTRSGTM